MSVVLVDDPKMRAEDASAHRSSRIHLLAEEKVLIE